MDSLRDEFNQCIKGREDLCLWKMQIKYNFSQGKKVNKTKYMKICNLYEDRKNRAIKLLEKINMNSRGVHHCMPVIAPPPPAPPKQPKVRIK